MLRIVARDEVVCELVREREVHAHERRREAPVRDVRVVPREVVAQVQEDAPAAVERDARPRHIAEHAQALRVDAKYAPDGAVHVVDEPLQRRAVIRQRRLCVQLGAHVHLHAAHAACEAQVRVDPRDVAVV